MLRKSGFLQKSEGFIQINISRTKKSLCNLNMVADIFTLSLNGYIYNEGNMPDEILIHRRDLCQRTYIKRSICLLFN